MLILAGPLTSSGDEKRAFRKDLPAGRRVSKPIAAPTARAASLLRANVAANYLSLAFVTLAGIVALPVYLRLLGVEAFGLVGFFTLLSAGFQVFDVGLSQTFARECARFTGGARDIHSLRRSSLPPSR